MTFALIFFWLSLGLLLLTYVFYAGITSLGAYVNREKQASTSSDFTPELTILIAAYNEESYIREKIENTLALDYPADKKKIIIVTDGSTDTTNEIILEYPSCQLLFKADRQGKIAAVDRAMLQVKTSYTVFTDANTMLNKAALLNLMRHFADPKVGAVAGEKKVRSGKGASAKGENLYWRYESFLKEMDANWHSVVGAAGELYAIRTSLFEPVPTDTLLDDFMVTLSIAKKGYRVAYETEAYAIEDSSLNIQEEMKRKIRICAGGFQSISRLGDLANPFKYGVLSIQYLIHRVFRWTVSPLALALLILSSSYLALEGLFFYQFILLMQMAFYGVAILGKLLPNRKWPIPGFYVPYYFVVMHWCAYLGFWRYLNKQQSVNWAKAKRANIPKVG